MRFKFKFSTNGFVQRHWIMRRIVLTVVHFQNVGELIVLTLHWVCQIYGDCFANNVYVHFATNNKIRNIWFESSYCTQVGIGVIRRLCLPLLLCRCSCSYPPIYLQWVYPCEVQLGICVTWRVCLPINQLVESRTWNHGSDMNQHSLTYNLTCTWHTQVYT